jgi:hypothetical protein
MRAIHFNEANKTYTKPPGMTDEECYEISAYEHRDENGKVVRINTVWQPNKEDIEAIMAGRPIVLQIMSSSLPPHALFTYDENGNINE